MGPLKVHPKLKGTSMPVLAVCTLDDEGFITIGMDWSEDAFVLLERAEAPLTSWKYRGLPADSEDGKWYSQDRKGSIQGNVAGLGLALAGGSAALVLGLQVFAVGGLVATLLAIACFVLLLNNGDVSSLPGYSPGTTSAWTRDEGWTVTYPNGTVSKQEGDGWTTSIGGAESKDDEDD